ncbi:MAG: type II toxin-antitoxin system RelE/ParE family toxin [Pseudomonadales bacterium]|nr:type II toxin-antitoxin system RelE/ParE family toxin [Pseudomonadales bacterium]
MGSRSLITTPLSAWPAQTGEQNNGGNHAVTLGQSCRKNNRVRTQRNTYQKALDKRFGCLAENPQLGKYRPDVAESYYSFPQGEHVIFHLIVEKGVDIIGIPYKEMEIVTSLPPV